MAKKFTVALINEKYQVFLPGFVEIEDLSGSDEIVDILAEYDSFESVSFLVEHSLFNDFPNHKNTGAIILMVITEIIENLTVNHKDSKNPLSSANALI